MASADVPSALAGAHARPRAPECAFRVMRLRAPSYEHGDGLALALSEFVLERALDRPGAPEGWAGGEGAEEDARARRASGPAATTTGELSLPRSFGAVALGETFSSLVTFGNFSRVEGAGGGSVREVGIKIELQTETRRLTLHDGTREPIAELRPGEKRDVVVTKDLKELGAHTLVCSATYYDEAGERKYSPQYFKFKVTNPLSVRTKTRAAPRGRVFLEVCVENATRHPLLLEDARFDAVEGIESKNMTPEFGGQLTRFDDVASGPGLPSLGKRAVYHLDPTGGAAHFLFEITRAGGDANAAPFTPTTQLGKLELRWRGAMGDPGRLQTQVIAAGSAGSSDPAPVLAKIRQSIIVDPLPLEPEDVSTVYVETPFTLRATVEALVAVDEDACVLRVKDVTTGVYLDGPRVMRVGALNVGQSIDIDVSCVALGLGVQTCPSLELCDVAGETLHAPPPVDVFSVREPPSERSIVDAAQFTSFSVPISPLRVASIT